MKETRILDAAGYISSFHKVLQFMHAVDHYQLAANYVITFGEIPIVCIGTFCGCMSLVGKIDPESEHPSTAGQMGLKLLKQQFTHTSTRHNLLFCNNHGLTRWHGPKLQFLTRHEKSTSLVVV
ncbi:hypothetical protein T02_379 [Trichinella nativa]|uniref:Uncharacterized protein n=1 Tax=Trichinella nativa TaxID=6335 RepID=A0A0V1LBW6_9BILA|nr:hypothetical protein T02_379 [Trichinella nativa]